MSSYIRKFMFALLVAVGGVLLMGGGKTAASHVPIPGGQPVPVHDYLVNVCGHTGQSPAMTRWISAPGAPTSTIVNVPYGTPSVNLDFHFEGLICYPNSDVHETRELVVNAYSSPAGAVSGIVGATLGLNYDPNYRSVGNYQRAALPFSYAPAGGFRTSGIYTIVIESKAQNRFSNRYGCVTSGGDYQNWNLDPCAVYAPAFQIMINVGPAPTISCAASSTSTVPASPEPGEDLRINTSFTVGGGPVSVPITYTILVNLPGTDPPPVSGSPGGVAALLAPLPPGRTGTGTLPNAIRPQAIRFSTAGIKNGTYQIITNGTTEPSDITCPFSVNVVTKPYFRVYGGDNMTGAGFGQACTPHYGAIIAWNKPVAPYVGAGSQLATFALNVIIDYASGAPDGSMPRVPTPAPQWANPKRLAFANAGAGPSGPGVPATASTAPGSTFGGGINAVNVVCAPDYYSQRPASATAITGGGVVGFTVDPASQGTYFRGGDLALLGPGTVGSPSNIGRELTIYVNGNVFIETPITYQNQGNFTSTEAIPRFRLIVQGNIFVHPSVGNLDGLYVAQPRAATNNTGFFYTCGNRSWGGNTPPYVPTAVQMASTAGGGCANTRLRVYGAVAAETVKLLRSVGTLRSASLSERYLANNTPANPGDPAEVFVFPPEMWFGSVSSGGGDYDSITALPPVL